MVLATAMSAFGATASIYFRSSSSGKESSFTYHGNGAAHAPPQSGQEQLEQVSTHTMVGKGRSPGRPKSTLPAFTNRYSATLPI